MKLVKNLKRKLACLGGKKRGSSIGWLPEPNDHGEEPSPSPSHRRLRSSGLTPSADSSRGEPAGLARSADSTRGESAGLARSAASSRGKPDGLAPSAYSRGEPTEVSSTADPRQTPTPSPRRLRSTSPSTFSRGGLCSSAEPKSSSRHSSSSADLPPDDIRHHLRRLGRKNATATTKLEALSTLAKLFAQKATHEVLQVVPQWAVEYEKLSRQSSQAIRLATNDTMSSLVTAVMEDLAPHLKSLMGPWWFSQFDIAPEVAQAAQRSFEAACRQLGMDAMLCVNETFLYLNDNLKLATQALSDKVGPMDEVDDMHQRVIASSLIAMATFIDIGGHKGFPQRTSATFSSAEAALSVHKHFIDFRRSESAVIRSATYTLLASYGNHVPHALNEEDMNMLSSKDAAAIPTEQASMLLQQRFTTLSMLVSRYQAELTAADLPSSQAEIAEDHDVDRLKMELKKFKALSSKLEAELTRYRKKHIDIAADLPDGTSRRPRKPVAARRPRKPVRRKRIPWTKEEEKRLKVGVIRFTQENGSISWVNCLKHGNRTYNCARTPDDLKRKYIHMKKKGIWDVG